MSTLTPQSTLRECWAGYLEAYRASQCDSTREVLSAYFRDACLNDLKADAPISEATTEQIASWLTRKIKQGRGWSNCSGALEKIGSFFRWAEGNDLVERTPVNRFKLPKLPPHTETRRVVFTYEEYQKVLEGMVHRMATDTFAMWLGACSIAFWTGMRMGDVASIQWSEPKDGRGTWVNMIDQIIIAHPMKRRRVNQMIEIPIEPQLYDELQRLSAERRPDTNFILPMMNFLYRTSRGALCGQFSDSCERAGLPNHTFHSFRHGFVTRLINAGVHPVIIGSMTGQGIKMIQHYSHVDGKARTVALATARRALEIAGAKI
jgi:integrase